MKRVVSVMPWVLAAVLLARASAAELKKTVEYGRDIRPVLSDKCFYCHGPDKNHREADLRLDVRQSAIDGGAIVPGKPDESGMVERIFSKKSAEQMPPPASGKTLTDAQRELFKRWIAEGAAYEGHWSYQPPKRPEIPAGANAIDFLIRRRLAEEGMQPSPEADRRTLIRRLHFDLLGLPPKPERVEAFVADAAPGAYERLVDELLASPHYGERMAIAWLDAVRFADTIGYHSDNPRNVWPYRDYVIRAFNENKPFSTFTIEQIAGDLLPESKAEQQVASCFNRLLLTTEEGGAQPKDYEARMLTDRVRAVGTVWLGQTFGCCQCHDHKFDPATMRDFYSLGAVFADVEEPAIGGRGPGSVVADPQQTAELARLDGEIAAARKAVESKAPEAPQRLAKAEADKKKFEDSLPRCLTTRSVAPRTVRLLPRGNWMDESGPVVEPALPAYLPGPKIAGRRVTRLDLAQWLVSRENPLTARVLANRLWKQFFGIGICRTLDDLGAQGEWPVHRELLDALAVDLLDGGWNVKQMVRAIVTSQTYRQTSVATAEQLAKDPENRLLGRQSRFRLDAELVRDNALSVSGLLVLKIGGPSVKPYQPAGYWENLNFPTRDYPADTGENQYRRGVYTWWQRTFLHPSLLAFDAPSREECAADRTRANIPQQALVLLNDPSYVEASRALAGRILKEGGPDTPSRIAWAWRQTLCRAPSAEETALMQALLDKQLAYYKQNPGQAEAALKVGLAPPPAGIAAPELAAWTAVARALLNLHETITRS